MEIKSKKLNSKQSPESIELDGSARARVLTAATKLFAEKGLAGTSTREIAKLADLNISLISYYFGGKEGLYKTVIREFAELASKEIYQLIDGLDLENLTKESFKKAMRSFLEGMLPLKFSRPEINILLQRELMAGLPHAKEVYQEVFSQVADRIVALYRIGQDEGFVKKQLNPMVVFLSMIHATDMYVHVNHCPVRPAREIPQIPRDMKAYIDQIYILFVEGILV